MLNCSSTALTFLMVSVSISGCKAQELSKDANTIGVTSIELSDGEKSFAADDFNNDGYIDLIVTEESSSRIIIFLNDGAGALERAGDYPAGSNPTWLTTLDIDGDGQKDLAIANHEATSITLLKGDGAGAFEPTNQSPLPIETEPHSHMIASADFNADGFPDIIVDSRDRLGIFILHGEEGGRFNTPGKGVDVNGAPYLGFAIGDINQDEMIDIVTPNRNDISVLLNRSVGELVFEKFTAVPFRSPFAVALADVTGDGYIDLIAASVEEGPGVTIFSGDGKGHFKTLKSFPIAAGAKTIAIGDINGDGISDAVVTSWNSDALLLIGGTQYLSAVQLHTNGLQNPWGVVFGDFNGDGRDEVVIGDAAGRQANIYSTETVKD